MANREHRCHAILPFTIGQLNAGCSTTKKALELGDEDQVEHPHAIALSAIAGKR